MEGELNKFGEENEALRGRLNLGREDSVDVSGVRARRVFELDKLRKENRMLENEVFNRNIWCSFLFCINACTY